MGERSKWASDEATTTKVCSEEIDGKETGREKIDARQGTNQMNQIASLCLAVNLIYAQQAVVRESWFGSDKIKHFFLSAFVESVAFSFAQAAGANRRTALASGIGAAAVVGLGREIHDKRTPGKWFSYRDLAWDAAGIGSAALLLSHTTK